MISLVPRQYKNYNTLKNTSTSNSWAQVVSRNATKSVKMHEKKNFAKSAKSNAWLSRRMIARSKNQTSNINFVEYRNKINNALKMHQKFDVLIQTIQLSRTEQHIVFTTIENFNAQKLIEYRNAWNNLFEFDEIKIDEKWHKAIVHDIEIEAFKSSNEMQQLQREIEQWNSIKLIRESMWLIKHENRINKRYSSIKVSFSSRNDLKNAIEKSIILAETQFKIVEFISTKSETQCNKCQKLEHTINTCNALAKCQICANAHNTHDHKNDVCKSNQIYPHIDLKSANCDKKHHVKNASGEVCLVLKLNARYIDQLHVYYIKFIKFRNAKEFRICKIANFAAQLQSINKCHANNTRIRS